MWMEMMRMMMDWSRFHLINPDSNVLNRHRTQRETHQVESIEAEPHQDHAVTSVRVDGRRLNVSPVKVPKIELGVLMGVAKCNQTAGHAVLCSTVHCLHRTHRVEVHQETRIILQEKKKRKKKENVDCFIFFYFAHCEPQVPCTSQSLIDLIHL